MSSLEEVRHNQRQSPFVVQATRNPLRPEDQMILNKTLGETAIRTDRDNQFQGGQLQQFIHKWQAIKAPDHVLSMLKGYAIPFVKRPPCVRLSQLNYQKYRTKTSLQMSREIQKLLNTKVLEKVYGKPASYHRCF